MTRSPAGGRCTDSPVHSVLIHLTCNEIEMARGIATEPDVSPVDRKALHMGHSRLDEGVLATSREAASTNIDCTSGGTRPMRRDDLGRTPQEAVGGRLSS